MKNTSKRQFSRLEQWTKKQTLGKTQQQALKGGYDPWVEKP